MIYKTDMHIHTWYSDGVLSPAAIVEKYAGAGFDVIAITDHEVTEGIAEAREAARAYALRVVAGIELATDYRGLELHILGYNIDSENARLKETLARLAAIREKRNEALLKALQAQGFAIRERDLIKRAGQEFIGKPDFARALANRGYIKDASEAFAPGQFLEAPWAKAIKREKIRTEEAIELIREAGGIPVLAHPGKIKGLGERESSRFQENFRLLLAELKQAGLKGLECIYPRHSDAERLFFIDTAGKLHLHITEGSDFHG